MRIAMTDTTSKTADMVSAIPNVNLTPGGAVRVFRELQEWTQSELAAASGIAQATISSIEHGRVKLGVERAERLARALKVHPAVLLWPNWKHDDEAAE
jgi:transcriptional regulator with XRE-family HTH domain